MVHWYQYTAVHILYLYTNELHPNFHSHKIQYFASPYGGTHPRLIAHLPGIFSCHSHASDNASCAWQGGEFQPCVHVCVCVCVCVWGGGGGDAM